MTNASHAGTTGPASALRTPAMRRKSACLAAVVAVATPFLFATPATAAHVAATHGDADMAAVAGTAAVDGNIVADESSPASVFARVFQRKLQENVFQLVDDPAFADANAASAGEEPLRSSAVEGGVDPDYNPFSAEAIEDSQQPGQPSTIVTAEGTVLANPSVETVATDNDGDWGLGESDDVETGELVVVLRPQAAVVETAGGVACRVETTAMLEQVVFHELADATDELRTLVGEWERFDFGQENLKEASDEEAALLALPTCQEQIDLAEAVAIAAAEAARAADEAGGESADSEDSSGTTGESSASSLNDSSALSSIRVSIAMAGPFASADDIDWSVVSSPANDPLLWAGNTAPYGQCTWWAYERRVQLGLPIGSTFGNGRDWANTARARGYSVSNTPTVGAVIVFQPGQAGADGTYGHVGIVESIDAAGNVTISESNVAGLGAISFRTFSAAQASLFQYVH
ncbi:CHAP domain-containing protein [Bifidobacterium choloepi]|nr:CHAP domain-containing protein [Bifidobacterium choloepi]